MPKGFFTGEKTHTTWMASILAQYFGSVAAWARLNEEKVATVGNVLNKNNYPDSNYQPNRRVLSKLYHDGFRETLLEDKLITSEFAPIPVGDIYWTSHLNF